MGTIGSAFGVGSSNNKIPSNVSLVHALSNTTSDGLGALCREGTASFLNSLVNNKFPYTTPQVRDTFVGSLVSDIAAAAQANLLCFHDHHFIYVSMPPATNKYGFYVLCNMDIVFLIKFNFTYASLSHFVYAVFYFHRTPFEK